MLYVLCLSYTTPTQKLFCLHVFHQAGDTTTGRLLDPVKRQQIFIFLTSLVFVFSVIANKRKQHSFIVITLRNDVTNEVTFRKVCLFTSHYSSYSELQQAISLQYRPYTHNILLLLVPNCCDIKSDSFMTSSTGMTLSP